MLIGNVSIVSQPPNSVHIFEQNFTVSPIEIRPSIVEVKETNRKLEIIEVGQSSGGLIPVVAKKFIFDTPALEWVAQHNLGSRFFTHTIRNSNGNLMMADVLAVDDNTVKAKLTSAMTGQLELLIWKGHIS
jgi:hypothetical protein